MALASPWRLALATSIFLARPPPVHAFIEEIFNQAFGGGGGGGFQFEDMGGGGQQQFFQMGGGQQQPRKPKWPKGISGDISKKFAWMKGTEWNWNNWRHVKFNKDGTFDAPTRDCQQGQCLWSASKGKVYILWGEAGLHDLKLIGEAPAENTPQAMKGLRIEGQRSADGEKCHAVFHRVFDHEAAELDKDLYEILGLKDDDDEGDIKKVYRKLSMKYHPDKIANPTEETQRKFNEIRDAYEILNDPDKKILYDTGGMEAVKKMEKGEVGKGDNIGVELAVTLEELYNSGVTKASLNRRIVCRGCRARPDSPKCSGCNRCPNEVKTVNQQVGPGMFMQREQEVASKEKCKQEQTTIDVNIEKGMRDGESLTFERMAEQRPGILPGAVVYTLKASKHAKFRRTADDLHMNMQVSLREALLGWAQSIRHLDGHILELKTDSVTKPFQVLKVKGEGMPLRDDPASFGDLYVKVEIIFPKSMTDEQAKEVDAIFAKTKPREEL